MKEIDPRIRAEKYYKVPWDSQKQVERESNSEALRTKLEGTIPILNMVWAQSDTTVEWREIRGENGTIISILWRSIESSSNRPQQVSGLELQNTSLMGFRHSLFDDSLDIWATG